MTTLLLLDNIDSFTYNLYDYFGQIDADCKVFRNDTALSTITQHSFDAVVLSPGPRSPKQAGNLLEVLDFYVGKLPILGICLGHQAIGEYFGSTLCKAIKPMHGKLSTIKTKKDVLFEGLPERFDVVRYHSLVLKNLDSSLKSIAQSTDGEIMAIRHKRFSIHGVQFHPEAICTEFGLQLLKNWLVNSVKANKNQGM